MKKHLLISLLIAVSLVFLLPDGAFAGQIPITELQMPSGETGTIGQGDYVSSTGGLNTYLSYFIEVPTGSTTLVVELYDADIGSDTYDRLRTAGTNTSVTYTLRRPDGTQVATKTCNSVPYDCAIDNGAWTNFYTVGSPAIGHWELRVDMGAGDDLNGFAIRAHDGDTTAGGTEYNLYADSFIDIGTHTVGVNGVYTNIFPFITSGCDFSILDWDMDGDGSISLTSRTGAFTYPKPTISGGTVWDPADITPPLINGWTADDSAVDYGIWSSNMTVGATTAANYTTIYIANYDSANPPPTAQPQANTFRMYFPTDGGSAPVKPILSQILTSPIPTVITGKTTSVNIQVTISNPTPYNITFSPTNLVTINVPGPTCPAATNSACYVGNSAAVTQGTVISQPAGGATGNITWNPGTANILLAGTSASLTYAVNVAPTADGNRILVTGNPNAATDPPTSGTRATYVDETGNTTQARATYTYGPLCGLAVTSQSGATGQKRFIRWREVFQ